MTSKKLKKIITNSVSAIVLSGMFLGMSTSGAQAILKENNDDLNTVKPDSTVLVNSVSSNSDEVVIFSEKAELPKATPKKKLKLTLKIDPEVAKKEKAKDEKEKKQNKMKKTETFLESEFTGPVKPIANNKHIITSHFGMRIHPIHNTARLHGGNDYKAECGEPLIATEDATVKYSQMEEGGYGWWIQIDTDKESFRYGHMKEQSPINVGEKIVKGQRIGTVGTTGGSTGCHLHFEELDKQEQKHDPTEYVDDAEISDILKD